VASRGRGLAAAGESLAASRLRCAAFDPRSVPHHARQRSVIRQ
jgi:hypothetical protein